MTFSNAPALLLLLTLLPVIWLGRPSPGFGRRREIISLAVRLILLTGLILALAGMQVRRKNDNLAVVFLLDVSDSMSGEAKSVAIDYIREALQAMSADDRAALITFGSNALVDRSMSGLKELEAIRSIPVTNHTDLAEAIRLAIALFPNDAARRMVILSDGRVTTGDAHTAAQYAAASGIEIIALPFSTSLENEVLISDLQAPDHLSENERFTIAATIEASQPGTATLRILADGQILYQGEHSINRGVQTISLPLIAGAPGFTSYLVQLEAANDTYYQNNEQYAYAQISGPPAVLLVAPQPGEVTGPANQPRPDEFSHLLRVLEAAGLAVESITPAQLPGELPLLAAYQAIILVDVPARQLSNQQMLALQTYVRDLGGGLVAIGGPTSFGVGGYYRTPLEDLLPVEMQIKDEQRRPSLAIVFVIDHSGSMSDTSGGAAKVDLAKEAAIRSIELLGPADRVGVVAFDDTATWVVEMTGLEDRQAVINAIGSIRSGGGTDILAGLQAMASVLPDDEARVKHVILLTDGGADPTGIPELVQTLYAEHGITLSTVAVGRDAAPYLPELAELGGGRFHFTAEPATIPSIFTEETSLATRAYLIEETFFPQLASSSPIVAGITQVPPLYGYVGTSIKDSAQLILVSPQGDPLLAAWQYGLGRSLAFTSDATSRWAIDWVGWDGFPVFWSQAVAYVLAQQSPSQLEIEVEQLGEQAQITVNAQNLPAVGVSAGQSQYINGYTIQANIIAPDKSAQTVTLQQTAPGQYSAKFTPDQQGVYLLRAAGAPSQTGESGAAPEPLAATAGWVLSYSPEYRSLESDPDALYRLAVTNGGQIAPQDPAGIFSHTLSSPPTLLPAWPVLLSAALLLLPVDIAIRRLVVTRADLAQFLAKLQPRRARPQSTAPTARSAQVESLLRAKQRVNLKQEQETLDIANQSQTPDTSAAAQTSGQLDAPPVNLPPAAENAQTTAAHLLARKRTRRSPSDQEPKNNK